MVFGCEHWLMWLVIRCSGHISNIAISNFSTCFLEKPEKKPHLLSLYCVLFFLVGHYRHQIFHVLTPYTGKTEKTMNKQSNSSVLGEWVTQCQQIPLKL
jgi:hypothetical protein